MKTAVGSVIFEGAEKYLRDFFLSLEMQTDQDFSIIIINDNISSEHLDQIIRQVSPNIKERLSIVDRTQSKLNPATLRVELLREAFYKDIDLLIMLDCDDKASSNRVCCVKEQLDPAYTFFYNELLDFNGNSIMKELPDYTLNYRDIGQSNYLGISNGAIFLKGISQAFIESLGEVETRIFDWYLYSRLLLNEKKGKKINGCYTYYRIYEANLVIFYAFILFMLWASRAKGVRSLGFTAFVSVIAVVSGGALLIGWKRRPESERLRYLALIGLYLVSFFMTFAYTESFIRFLGLAPFIGCILFFDPKYSRIGGIGYLVLNALTVFGQIRQQPEGVAGTTNLVLDLLALGVLVFAVIFTTNVAQKFNHDTRHSEQQEQRKQQAILDDVIGVAEEVRKGTESVMKIVNDLNGSTGRRILRLFRRL